MPPIQVSTPTVEFTGSGPAPADWEAIPGLEIRLTQTEGYGPKAYTSRVDVSDQEGRVSYRILVDGVPAGPKATLDAGNNGFKRSKTEPGPDYPERVITVEWRQETNDGGLAHNGRVVLRLTESTWGMI